MEILQERFDSIQQLFDSVKEDLVEELKVKVSNGEVGKAVAIKFITKNELYRVSRYVIEYDSTVGELLRKCVDMAESKYQTFYFEEIISWVCDELSDSEEDDSTEVTTLTSIIDEIYDFIIKNKLIGCKIDW